MLYGDTQSHVDRGGSADHSTVGIGADLELFQGLGHELWLGELSDLRKEPSP